MKQILAAIIDFLVGVIGTAWILSRLQGAEMTFSLYNAWLIIWIITIIAYFVVAKKVWGQSLGKKLLKLKPKK